jgi:type II secretory pathway pseudopilin PulG
MIASTVTLNVPDVAYILSHHWQVTAVLASLFIIAVLSSVLLDVYRRHYNKKQQIQLAKHYTALLLAALTTVFTALGYFLVFAQGDPSWLKGIPFVAEHSTEAVGIAVTLYNIRLNKWYQSVADKLNTWSKSADEAEAAGAIIAPSVPADVQSVPVSSRPDPLS